MSTLSFSSSPRSLFSMVSVFALALCTGAMADGRATPQPAAGSTTNASGKTGILLVAFGTSTNVREKTYGAMEKAVRDRFPGKPVVMSFTSQMIRKKLAKSGIQIPSIAEALDQLKKEGVTKVAVQSLHIVPGEEFHEMVREVRQYCQTRQNSMNPVFGRPLIVSRDDLRKTVKAALDFLPKERKTDEAVVFMGHGNSKGECDTAYIAADAELQKLDPNAMLATVEGGMKLEDAESALHKLNVKTVWLAPFMVVAGDHAQNDLCGPEEDSWKSRLEKKGWSCRPSLKGLGECPVINQIFLEHLDAAMKELEK